MHDGTPKILPRPYSTSKPRSSGYKLIRTSWFQSLLKDIETQVIHFLQNISFRSSSVIKALLSISLSKQIIPECLRLGDTCFTHMTTFGTLGKEDGSMPIHFDERDAVSCIFHLGSVVKGGATQYYDGTDKKMLVNTYLAYLYSMAHYRLVYFLKSCMVLNNGKVRDEIFNLT